MTEPETRFDIADGVAILDYLFTAGGSPPPPPGPTACGPDPAGDTLDCAAYTSCP